MITSFFTARIGKDATVIEKNGKFISMDCVVNDKVNGKERTRWVRVTSGKSNHINLAQYLTKGKVITIVGDTSATAWIDKNGNAKPQLNVVADRIEFMNFGKRKVETQQPSGDVAVETPETPDTDEPPF